MIKHIDVKVTCPHSVLGHPNTVSVLYIEENGETKISGSNGCDNLNGSDACRSCLKTISEDFKAGRLKASYVFGQ